MDVVAVREERGWATEDFIPVIRWKRVLTYQNPHHVEPAWRVQPRVYHRILLMLTLLHLHGALSPFPLPTTIAGTSRTQDRELGDSSAGWQRKSGRWYGNRYGGEAALLH